MEGSATLNASSKLISPVTVRNPPAKRDTWASQLLNHPLIENPVRAFGELNQYVALWRKNGRPINGRAWNNGGVVKCSFPFFGVELIRPLDLSNQIQILQYNGDHNTLGFWYEWIKYKERFEKLEHRQWLRCGESMPLFWTDRKDGNPICGYINSKTEIAKFSYDGISVNLGGSDLDNMMMLVRNTKGGPPFCECWKTGGSCPNPLPLPTIFPPGPLPPRLMTNEWIDIRAGDKFPKKDLVKALGKPLDTLPGQSPDQYVALWYQHGEPIMGRVWNDNGKVAATFGWFTNEYKDNIGSIQLLIELNEDVRGYDYEWKPFEEIVGYGEREWYRVIIEVDGYEVSPCVLTLEGKQILGRVDVSNECAAVAYNGVEHIFIGSSVYPFFVLARKAKTGYNFD